jgi:hypothetical protein
MHALTPIAERAVRLPVGPAHPGVTAGVTFTALRDASPFPRGISSWRIFGERFDELVVAAAALAATKDPRAERAHMLLVELAGRVRRAMPTVVAVPAPAPVVAPIA